MEFKARADVVVLSFVGALVAAAVVFNAMPSMPKDKDQCLLQVAANAATEYGAKVSWGACDRVGIKYSRGTSWPLGVHARWEQGGRSPSNRSPDAAGYEFKVSIKNNRPDREVLYVDVLIQTNNDGREATYRAYCESVGPYSMGSCIAEIDGPLPVKDGAADWGWGIEGAVFRDVEIESVSDPI